jgi:hypothetical protein
LSDSSDSDDDEKHFLHSKAGKDKVHDGKTYDSLIQHCYCCESSTTSDSDDTDEMKFDDENILEHCNDEDDSLLVIF